MSDDDILKFDGETGDPMTWTADQTLEIETRAILAAFPSVRVERSGVGWLVGLGFVEGQIHHVGHTSIDPNTSDDPRDMARRLAAIAGAPVFPPEDEDPGEQPEIYDDEVLEGGGEPAGENAEHDAGPGEQDQVAGAVDHGGMMIEQLSDQLSIRRAQVIDRITAIEEIRLEGLEDRLAARDEAIRNYNNWPAGVAMDPAVEAAAREWMQLDALASAIRRHASNLRRSARDASADILLSMWGSAINEGWPTDG